jgi:MFS family permease
MHYACGMTTAASSLHRIHPAWIVLGAMTLCMAVASGVRAVFGVYVKPMEAEFGWSRAAISGVAALSLLLLGAVGPLAGRLADRWGPRRVTLLAVVLLGVGAIGAAAVQSLWQAYLTTGLLMGIGSGGLGLATGSVIAIRWFEGRRGLAIGIAAGGMSAGQLVIIPLATALMLWFGWRLSFLALGLGLLVVALPIALWLIRDDPADRDITPYGATGPALTAREVARARTASRVGIVEAAQHAQFWLLAVTSFVCGYTSVGLILTHFVPHALEHNFSQLEATTALAVMGAMNVLGTLGSGWLCDRFGRRGPLATYYLIRGLSLVFLLYVWNAPSLHVWAAVFGLNWVSTVPPTTTLTASIFGRYSVGELSGWIYFAHQVGSALSALSAGWIFEVYGGYAPAFVSAALMALVAAGLTMLIREEPVTTVPMAPAPATT